MFVSPDVPLQLGMDSRQQFCLQSLPSLERLPLQYTVCVARNVKAAHQEAAQQFSHHGRELPNLDVLWSVQLTSTLAEIFLVRMGNVCFVLMAISQTAVQAWDQLCLFLVVMNYN